MTSVLGAGWAFPPCPTDRRLALAADDERIQQSIRLILATAPGERVMLPDFGCGLHDLVFAPNTASVRGSVRADVHDALVRWEPRIDVIDVVVSAPAERPEMLVIDVRYRIRATNTTGNLVYPLFLAEGTADPAGQGSVPGEG